MRLLSIIMLVVLVSINNIAFAETDGEQKKGKSVEHIKTKILQGITARIETMNRFKSCVENAGAHAELKACRKEHRSAMQALKKKHQKNRKM